MAHPINALSSCNEIIYGVLEYLEPKENIAVMPVCTNWRDIAADVAKKQYIIEAEDGLNLKMRNFLALAGGEAVNYCPALSELKGGRGNFSIKEVRDRLERLIEKHEVALGPCHIVEDMGKMMKAVLESIIATARFEGLTEEAHAAQMEGMKRTLECLTLEGSNDPLGGKPFVSLLLKVDNRIGQQWMSEGISFFPLALFNLKIEGRKIIGQEPEGPHCFPLKGRLFEFWIVPPNPNLFNRGGPEVPRMPKMPYAAYYDPKLHAFANEPAKTAS